MQEIYYTNRMIKDFGSLADFRSLVAKTLHVILPATSKIRWGYVY